MTGELLQCIRLLFHNFRHHSGTQFKAVLEDQAMSFNRRAYHNIGVICQGHQMFAEAIEAYKESLRNNPADNETRYNLALCMRQQKNQQNGNDKKQQDKDKEKKDDNKKQQDKEKQQQNKEDQKQPPAKENMSKENAEQLLNAAMQEEKATQQRLKKAAQQPPKRNLQKNW